MCRIFQPGFKSKGFWSPVTR